MARYFTEMWSWAAVIFLAFIPGLVDAGCSAQVSAGQGDCSGLSKSACANIAYCGSTINKCYCPAWTHLRFSGHYCWGVSLGCYICLPCSHGQESVPHRGLANNCEHGVDNICQACPAGNLNNRPDQQICQTCPDSTISSSGAASCTYCSDTNFKRRQNAMRHVLTGKRQLINITNRVCTTCYPGTYNNIAYEKRGAYQTCTYCPGGNMHRSRRRTESDACLDCPAGKYRAGTDHTTNRCHDCPKGMFSPNNRLSACLQCPANTYQPATGATVCINCNTLARCPEDTCKSSLQSDDESDCVACQDDQRQSGVIVLTAIRQMGILQKGASVCTQCP